MISPLNYYENETCGLTGGNEISNAGGLLADSTAAVDPMVVRGPDLGPLSSDQVGQDKCHPSDAGQLLLGQQLIGYFDQ